MELDFNLNEQWNAFMTDDNYSFKKIETKNNNKKIPCCSSLNISTKSKIIYLNKTFILEELFWKLKIIDYDSEQEGILKKQIKFNFLDKKQVEYFEKMIQNEKYVSIKILNQVDNPSGRVTFKDVRKVDIGFSKNDILKTKKKSKSAFYNCFVIIYRKIYNGSYREFHIKLFNSGKIEIPGIQSDDMLNCCIDIIISILQPHYTEKIEELKNKQELVLVNSNFNCGYYLNREKFLNILKSKYNIKCGMDSCSYPGIQCKYKLSNDKEISFMIFRTGSVLIAGKCNDNELNTIYEYLKNIFHNEYYEIYEEQSQLEKIEKEKTIKNKKKTKKKVTIFI